MWISGILGQVATVNLETTSNEIAAMLLFRCQRIVALTGRIAKSARSTSLQKNELPELSPGEASKMSIRGERATVPSGRATRFPMTLAGVARKARI